MHCIKATYPLEWPTANVYPLADWHIGDPHCVIGDVYSVIQRVQDDPHGLAVLNGDLLNTALKNSVSDVYGETMKPIDQINELVGLLKPIQDKIIGVTTGNHEARVYRNDGVDIMRLVCRELGVEDKYHPDGVLIFLRFGTMRSHDHHGIHTEKARRLFTIYATHGSGGGRKEGAKAIRLADMAAVVDADAYLHSHSHLPMIMRESFFRTNAGNSSARRVDKLFVNTGSTLEYGGYGQAQEFKPNSMLTPVVHLDAATGHLSATL